MAVLTYDQVSQILKYDPATGKLFWLPRSAEMFKLGKISREHNAAKWNSRYAETEAFTYTTPHGYKCGQIEHSPYLAHLVIWLLISRTWPTMQIDHINGDRADNRLANLRHISQEENHLNQKRPSDNSSGVIGVSWTPHVRKWHAYINKGGKRTNLGWYHELADAKKARQIAETAFGFHPNHGRPS